MEKNQVQPEEYYVVRANFDTFMQKGTPDPIVSRMYQGMVGRNYKELNNQYNYISPSNCKGVDKRAETNG